MLIAVVIVDKMRESNPRWSISLAITGHMSSLIESALQLSRDISSRGQHYRRYKRSRLSRSLMDETISSTGQMD